MPPEEFLVLPFMERKAKHWVVSLRCTPELAEAAVMASADTISIGFDPSSPPDHRAAGSCGLEVREDGVWAIGIEWTDAGKAALRVATHVVPAMHLFENGDVRDFIALGLTNQPEWQDVGRLH